MGKKNLNAYIPNFGAKGWGIALMGMAFYYFYQGPLNVGINFYYGYFETLYGWTNTQLSAAVSIGLAVGVLGLFVWGPVNKRIGSKITAIIGLVGAAASNLAFASSPSLTTFYISVIGFSFFCVAYSQIAVATFAANWFPRTRGMYMGMATMGMTAISATGTAFASLFAPTIGVSNWLVIQSGIMLVIAVLIGLFVKNNPEEAGAWPDNDRTVSREELEAEQRAAEEYLKNSPWTVNKVLKCRYTWTIGIGWGISMMCAGGFIAQLVPALISFGHDSSLGVVLLASLWPAGVLGNYLGGVLDNLVGTKKTSIILNCIEILNCIAVATFGSSTVVVAVSTAIYMAAMSAFSNVTVSMVTSVFGRQDFAAAWPIVSVPYKLIESFGVLLISLIAAAASYKVCYYALAVVLLVSLALMFATTDKQIASHIHGEQDA